MADNSGAHPAVAPRVHDDEDPDSPGRSTFFSRLFRRDAAEEADDADSEPEARQVAGEMLKNLSNVRVDDVSVPRADIVAVPDSASLADVVDVFRESTLSRLPVYTETLDQPIGLVHLKDLALQCGFGAPADGFDVKSVMRPLLYVPPSMPISVLLQKMQSARIHMALVIDEYGGVDGLVTIEDLIEEIVGDISDEHDEDETPLWSQEAPGVYVAQGRLDLDDFEAETGVPLLDPDKAEDIDTLGGLVFALAGRVPSEGEVITHPAGHAFEVLDADSRIINRLRVKIGGEAQAAAAE